jgi:MFS family permease
VNPDTTSDKTPRPPLGPAYWRLWGSSALSNLADGIFKVGLPLVAIRFTREPGLIAGLSFAITLPWLLFSLQAGAMADRLDRRRAMLGANLVRTALLIGLGVLAGLDLISIWMLFVFAFGIGIAETVYDTSSQSILPQLVSRDQLSRANGRLYAAELTANQFLGPPLGGFLIAAGVVVGLVTPAALWLVAVGVLWLVRGSFRVTRDQPSKMRSDIAEGIRYLWNHRLLRTLAIVVGFFNLASNAVFPLFVIFAVGPESEMGLSEPAYGALLTTIAAGSLVGSFAAEYIERLLGRARSLLLTAVGGAVLVGAPALTAEPIVLGVAFFVGGSTVMVWNVITVSLRQRIAPDHLLGRVNSGYRLMAWGTMPLGAALGGVLGQILGVRPVFAIMAVLTLTLLIPISRITDARIEAAEAEAET